MSVSVTIDIANGAAKRTLYIERQTEPRFDEDGRRDLTDINEYAVLLSGGRFKGSRAVVARFHHRYSEDVLALITTAIAALRREGVDQA